MPGLKSETKFFDMHVEEAARHLSEAREILIKRQFEEWPDSRIMTLSEVYKEWMDKPPANALDSALGRWESDLGILYDNAGRITARLAYAEKWIADYRANVARSISLVLQHPVFVFYECGRNRQYRGCRVGVEGSEYISGFGRY